MATDKRRQCLLIEVESDEQDDDDDEDEDDLFNLRRMTQMKAISKMISRTKVRPIAMRISV
jgi:hypothetical protein